MPPVISVEHLSKSYRLGQIGTGTFARDLSVWWARVRGKPNPLLRIGETDHGNRVGEEIWALRDVSFTVDQGEVLGVIGRNGAGKSTLLKILSRVTAPTSGQVKVRGRIASLLEVGTGFHPELTGRENIYLNGAILGMTRQEVRRKFDEIVAFAEVEKFIDTPVKRYSSGMYVRLAFAVAAHLESEILLVDEVLAVGDAEFQKKCLGKMGDVASKEGRTVLFVSHNMGSIGNLCSRSILMQSGEVARKGETDDIVDLYLNAIQITDGINFNDRQGNQKVFFNDFVIEPQPLRSSKLTTFYVNLGVSSDLQVAIEFYLAVSFRSRDHSAVLTYNSRHVGKILIIPPEKRGLDVKIEVDSLPLTPGKYYISLWCGSGNQTLDFLRECLMVEVESAYSKEATVFIENTGYPVFLPSKWTLESGS